jgi:hypothetical protein
MDPNHLAVCIFLGIPVERQEYAGRTIPVTAGKDMNR